MIHKRVGKINDVMAIAAIGCCSNMILRRIFSCRVNTIMAVPAHLVRGQRSMVNTNGRNKTIRGVAGNTIAIGDNMIRIFTRCRYTIMTTATVLIDTGMIKAAIQPQLQKTGGVVAVIAFFIGWNMAIGLTYRCYAVMTGTAITKYVAVIHEGDHGEPKRCMARLALVGGSNVVARLTDGACGSAIMTGDAIIGKPGMVKGTGGIFSRIGDDNGSNRRFTNKTARAYYELHFIGAGNVGNKTGALTGWGY